MEKFLIATGKTIDLAIQAALDQLSMDRDSVSVEVLENAKSGFLGIGAQPAKVKVSYEVPDEEPKPALSSASRSKPKKESVPAAQSADAPRVIAPAAPKQEPAGIRFIMLCCELFVTAVTKPDSTKPTARRKLSGE